GDDQGGYSLQSQFQGDGSRESHGPARPGKGFPLIRTYAYRDGSPPLPPPPPLRMCADQRLGLGGQMGRRQHANFLLPFQSARRIEQFQPFRQIAPQNRQTASRAQAKKVPGGARNDREKVSLRETGRESLVMRRLEREQHMQMAGFQQGRGPARPGPGVAVGPDLRWSH